MQRPAGDRVPFLTEALLGICACGMLEDAQAYQRYLSVFVWCPWKLMIFVINKMNHLTEKKEL